GRLPARRAVRVPDEAPELHGRGESDRRLGRLGEGAAGRRHRTRRRGRRRRGICRGRRRLPPRPRSAAAFRCGGAARGRGSRRLGGGPRSYRGNLSTRAGATSRAGTDPDLRSGVKVHMAFRPRVAVTMGDAAGISPEIIVKSLADPAAARDCIPLVLGDRRVLERAMDATGVRVPIRTIASAAEAEGRPSTIELVDYANVDIANHRWGEVNPAHGEAAVHYTREAGRLALAGEIDAMVSAPLNKEAMHAAGHPYEGQTEILGELTGTKPAMLLLLGQMRLMLFTNHMALRAVCDYVRKDRVLERLVLADAALRDMGIAKPRLAVAGLNPRAGEEGAFGHEERDEIVPALEAARARGIDARGPFPADTVFLRARDG